MSDISRIPTQGETHDQLVALHRTRCEMAPDGADLVLAAGYVLDDELGFGTVACDRAKRAGIEPRVEVISKLDLGDWRQAVKAVFAAGFGPLTDRHKTSFWGSSRSLYHLVYQASSRADAARILEAFKTGRELDYLAEKVILAVEAAISPDQCGGAHRARRIEEVAHLAGLIACAADWEYYGTANTLGHHHNKGDRWDIAAILAHGRAYFQGDISAVLAYWSGLANPRGKPIPFPEMRNDDSLLNWAHAHLTAAADEEGGDAPKASAKMKDGDVVISWDGSWTRGRWFTFTFRVDDAGTPQGIASGEMEWSSATGRPSRFLALEGLLADANCYDFDQREVSPDEA